MTHYFVHFVAVWTLVCYLPNHNIATIIQVFMQLLRINTMQQRLSKFLTTESLLTKYLRKEVVDLPKNA